MLSLLMCALTVASAAAPRQHPAFRHVGRWSAPPALPQVVPQNTRYVNGTATHDPSYMMQPNPLAGNGDVGLCFGGPAEATTFHLTTTSFWCSNVAPDSSKGIPHYSFESGLQNLGVETVFSAPGKE